MEEDAVYRLNRISTHAPRTGSDISRIIRSAVDSNFNPRSPHGERHAHPCRTSAQSRFQPTLPARGATAAHVGIYIGNGISTHAPRTGSDIRKTGSAFRYADFNPRSPHGERLFCSIHRARIIHFNPRSPHGERRLSEMTSGVSLKNFNPRSPHGERRLKASLCEGVSGYFNPRSPHGERLNLGIDGLDVPRISTHAPRTGSDAIGRASRRACGYFNPRSPHGERL